MIGKLEQREYVPSNTDSEDDEALPLGLGSSEEVSLGSSLDVEKQRFVKKRQRFEKVYRREHHLSGGN